MNRFEPYRKRLRFMAWVIIIGTLITILFHIVWFIETAKYTF
jgi:hypothetical protein